VIHASGSKLNAQGILPIDPSVGGEVSCTIWMEGNNFTGPTPQALCNRTWNEVYLSYPAGQVADCERPCIEVAYSEWPMCPNGSQATCTKCSARIAAP